MNNPDDAEAFERTVSECQAKMELIDDYLERFKIKDMRIVAPIRDIERYVMVMAHLLHELEGELK